LNDWLKDFELEEEQSDLGVVPAGAEDS